MATKKDSGTGRYRILRDCAAGKAGDTIQLDDDTAADLQRDGMIEPVEEG